MSRAAGEVNADYKNKYRTLLFNLKDAHNPELRARVLMGDIPPAKLVRMTSEQLASKVRAMSDPIQWHAQGTIRTVAISSLSLLRLASVSLCLHGAVCRGRRG